MSFSHAPTVDELLADGLVQAVMRADHVEPNELRALLGGVAGRIARRREGERKAARFFATPLLAWRPRPDGANARALAAPTPVAEPCGAGLCC
jgi:hypothetical protein